MVLCNNTRRRLEQSGGGGVFGENKYNSCGQ